MSLEISPSHSGNWAETVQIKKSKLILGEGKEEIRFFYALLKHLRIDDVQVMDYRGKTNFQKNFPAFCKMTGFSKIKSIAITRDSDENVEGAFQSINSVLDKLKLPKPEKMKVFYGENPRIGVFLFPDSLNNGMLEDLCIKSVENDTAYNCVQSFFECMDENNRKPKNQSKAIIHAWLSSCEKPDLRLGEAAEKGYWDWSNPAFADIKDFINAI